MQIHHLNCGSVHPRGGRAWDGSQASLLAPATLVCHCLALDFGDEIVLVDTGLGTPATVRPRQWLGAGWVKVFRPVLDPAQTALAQLEQLGLDPSRVRSIIATHLDGDHAGGLSDFPQATVYVHNAEYSALRTRRTTGEKARYRDLHFSHGPRWMPLPQGAGTWMGLPAIRNATGLSPDIVLVPLPGHSRGLMGVAVRRPDDTWLLHAGDAYFSHLELAEDRRCPPLLDAFRRFTATLPAERVATLKRLRMLAREHRDEVTIVSSHDAAEFTALAGRPAPVPVV